MDRLPPAAWQEISEGVAAERRWALILDQIEAARRELAARRQYESGKSQP